jgi:lysozyme
MTVMLEGLRLNAYQDEKGVWTIGYGHTSGVKRGMTCTKAQAIEWLHQDLAEAAAGITKLLQVPVTQRQFDALCVLVFNVGVGAFERSKMRRRINEEDPKAAVEFLDWCYVTVKGDDGISRKVKSRGLENRRKQEHALFCADAFPVIKAA